MGTVKTKQDHQKERAAHVGKTHYKIFYKDKSGNKITVFDFWSKNKDTAQEELEVYKMKKRLVDPDDTHEYFYGSVGEWVLDLGNGTIAEFDDMESMMHHDRSNESTWEKICDFFRPVKWWVRDMKCALVDFWFWYKHYDKRTNKSHMRSESWNLDSTLLDMLEFNIPIIIDDQNGVPNDFCTMARKKLRANVGNSDTKKQTHTNPNSDDEELKLAKEMWNDELRKCLLHIRLYRYYSDNGVVDPSNKDYVEIDKLYKDTIPYVPSTDKEIDYSKMSGIIQHEWNAIWDWWKKYGQMCWT